MGRIRPNPPATAGASGDPAGSPPARDRGRRGRLIGVNDDFVPDPDLTDPDLIPLPDAAALLNVDVTLMHQLIREGQLVAVTDARGRRSVPRIFVESGAVLKGLPGVITLLRDARFSDSELIAWLFRRDESLPGTPAHALAENRGTEVKRRAQSAGF
jgi:hypothetical protein